MISKRAINKEKREQLKRDINRMLQEGYVLYKEKYLISMNNEAPYRLYKDGCAYYTIMKPIAINLTGSIVKNVEYLYKSVGFDGTSRYYLHRLIWEAFKGPIPKKMTIDHIDGNKKNNNLHNLQLLTQGQNSRKGILKTMEDGKYKGKEAIPVRCIETGHEFDSMYKAARWLVGFSKTSLEISTTAGMISQQIHKKKSSTGYILKSVKGFTFELLGKAANDLKRG